LATVGAEKLEEKRHSCVDAAVPDAGDPGWIGRAPTWPGLSACDDPADAVQVKALQRADQRLAGQEPDGRRHCPQVADTVERVAVLDGDAHPQVRWPVQLVGYFAHPGGALGEDLVGVLWRVGYDGKYVSDEAERDAGMEQVAHRVHEYDSR